MIFGGTRPFTTTSSSHSSPSVSSSSASTESSRRGERFEDYTDAIRRLSGDGRFPPELVKELKRLPGFRNVLVHEYVALDPERAIDALGRLGPIWQFLEIVRTIESA